MICVKLDEENIPAPDFIKIDVEGHEPQVIDGMKKILINGNPIIMFEINKYWLLHNSKITAVDLVDKIRSLGFEIYNVEDNLPFVFSNTSENELENYNVYAKRG